MIRGGVFYRPGRCGFSDGGFTLTELMMALGIFAMVSVTIFSVYGSLSRSYTTENVRAYAQQSARTGIDFMSRDVRMAGLDPKEISGAGLSDFAATSMEFTLDRDANGQIETGQLESLAYVYNGSDLVLYQVLDPGTSSQQIYPLVDNITGLSFAYLDNSGAQTTDKSLIRSVKIRITVEESAGQKKRVERTYESLVGFRNLGL